MQVQIANAALPLSKQNLMIINMTQKPEAKRSFIHYYITRNASLHIAHAQSIGGTSCPAHLVSAKTNVKSRAGKSHENISIMVLN